MIKSITILVIFLGGFNSVFSQENGAVINSNELEFVAAPLKLYKDPLIEGTYQIVFKNGTVQHDIEEELLAQINTKRADETIVIITVDENTEIRILPYSIINAADFVSVTKYIFE